MENLPAIIEAPVVPVTLRQGAEAAFRFAQRKRADSTRGGYAADFRLFAAWCRDNGLASLPATPGAVATYIAMEAERGIRPATLGRRLAAIRHTHRDAGHEPPTDNRHVRDVLAGIRNALGVAPDRKAPATADRPELTKRPSGTHKQTYQERFGGATAEIRRRCPEPPSRR